MNHDVVVIGAGVSGLCCAHELVSRNLDVKVLERQVVSGGNAKSVQFDGFLMELGPTTLNAASPLAMAAIQELGLNTSARELGQNVRKRYLFDERGLHGISTKPLGFFTSNYLSPLARMSLAAEIMRPRRSTAAEETIHQFASRRFGAEFADKIVEPMVAGIFMGDSRSLSMSGTFSRLVDLEQRFGSIVRGVLAAKKGSDPSRRLLSWDDGISALPKTFARLLGERVSTGIAVTKITRYGSGFRVTTAKSGTITCRSVVLAVQPHVASSLLADLDPETSAVTGQITAPAIGVVYLGYRENQVEHKLDGLGYLCTKNASKIISGVQFCSTMFGARAPDGHVSISCYVGGSRGPQNALVPENELVSLVSKELSNVLGIKGAPVVARTHRWPRGLPQYALGHEARRKIIEETSHRTPGLYLTGNFLNGVSVSNCLEAATTTSNRVFAALEAVPRSSQRKLS